MAQEVIKEVITSTPASAESKSEYCTINTTKIIDGNSVTSYLKRKEKPVPHYQRASTGSCHDNCKFGIQHSSESNKYWPVSDWRQDRANARNGKQDQAEIIPQGGKPRNKDQKLKISHAKDGSAPAKPKPDFTKPKPLLKLKGAPDRSESSPCVELLDESSEPVVSGNQPAAAKCLIISHDNVSNCGDGEFSEGAVSVELEMPLAIQDSDESVNHIMDVVLPSEDAREAGEQSPVDHVPDHSANECVSSEKRTNQTVMVSEKHEQDKHVTKSGSLSKESVKPKVETTPIVTRKTTSSQKIGIASHQMAAGTAVESSNGQKTTRKQADVSAPNKFNRERQFSSIVTSAFPKVKGIKVTSPSSAKDSSARPATLPKLKVLTTKTAPSPSLPSDKLTDRNMTVKNVAKIAPLRQKKGEVKVILSPVKLSRSISMLAKSLSSIKMRAYKKENSVSPMKSNKKIYGIESFTSDHKEKLLKTASPRVRKPEVNIKESRSRKEKTASPRTESARRAKSASISSSTIAQSPRKLTFRRGTVLNLHGNSENNTPRRLRFRPVKATEDSSRIKESTRGRIARNSDTSASDASQDAGASRVEVVVLRHQDGKHRKKNEQGLLNIVIEETASKLVEVRKSKVKALVGAFETVISLQEKQGNPS